jgi:hypothetical protein
MQDLINDDDLGSPGEVVILELWFIRWILQILVYSLDSSDYGTDFR